MFDNVVDSDSEGEDEDEEMVEDQELVNEDDFEDEVSSEDEDDVDPAAIALPPSMPGTPMTPVSSDRAFYLRHRC